jgi:hypothetical protein
MSNRAEQIRALRRRWGRTAFGSLLILHGLGHVAFAFSAANRIANPGAFPFAVTDRFRALVGLGLLVMTVVTLLAGGIAALPGKPFLARWRAVAATGLLTSIALLGWTLPAGTVQGTAIDIALLIAVVKAEGIWTPAGDLRPRRLIHRTRLRDLM